MRACSCLVINELADQSNKLDEYFNRMDAHNLRAASGGFQTRLEQFGMTGQAASPIIDREEIARCSFSEFWRMYRFVSGGRGNSHQIVRRDEPTIVTIKPHMPSSWNKPGHEKRPEYCKIMLLKHMAFEREDDFKGYVFREHQGDWEAAYEEFAMLDPSAPDVCKDDFGQN